MESLNRNNIYILNRVSKTNTDTNSTIVVLDSNWNFTPVLSRRTRIDVLMYFCGDRVPWGPGGTGGGDVIGPIIRTKQKQVSSGQRISHFLLCKQYGILPASTLF